MPLEFDDPDGDGVLAPHIGSVRQVQSGPGGGRRHGWAASFSPPARSCDGRVHDCLVMIRHYARARPTIPHRRQRGHQATGLTEVSRSQMLPVFGEDIGRNVFFVPVERDASSLSRFRGSSTPR